MNKLLLLSLLLSVAVLSGCKITPDGLRVAAERVCEARGYHGAIVYEKFYQKDIDDYAVKYQCYVFTGLTETLNQELP